MTGIPFLALSSYYSYFISIVHIRTIMHSLMQLSAAHKRQWILMDTVTCLPLLIPLRYHIDNLSTRSLSTQSASLQALKFFYEFWHQKYGVTFCYSFHTSCYDPSIAIDEMPNFFQYLENGRSSSPNVLPLHLITSVAPDFFSPWLAVLWNYLATVSGIPDQSFKFQSSHIRPLAGRLFKWVLDLRSVRCGDDCSE